MLANVPLDDERGSNAVRPFALSQTRPINSRSNIMQVERLFLPHKVQLLSQRLWALAFSPLTSSCPRRLFLWHVRFNFIALEDENVGCT